MRNFFEIRIMLLPTKSTDGSKLLKAVVIIKQLTLIKVSREIRRM